MNLANFMQAQIFSCIAALRPGIDILRAEKIKLTSVCGHGGFFKTPEVGQLAMSALIEAPVTTFEHAGEGGAWGISLLALFAAKQENNLQIFLSRIFKQAKQSSLLADEIMVQSFNSYYQTLVQKVKK